MTDQQVKHKNHLPFLGVLSQSRNEQLRYLAQSVKMEEAVNPHIVNASMTLISLAIVIFLIWAAVTEINEVAKAEGEVVPKGFTQVVQHLDGGLVTEILINEGDLIQEGQVLVRIDDGGARQDLAEAIALQNSLKMQRERLLAFVEERGPDFSAYHADEREALQQMRYFNSMIDARAKESAVIKEQIAQRQEILNTLNAQAQTLEKNIEITDEIMVMTSGLADKGSVSTKDTLETKMELNALQGELSETQADIAGAQRGLAEYNNRLSSLNAKHRDDAFAELDTIESGLKQNQEVVRKLENRVARLDIKAPVTGLIKGLQLNTIGGVVQPGRTLMEIVPLDKNLVVEAKISTADIGHVAVGQNVKVKVRSYDFARYGAVQGRLDFVTATTFLDELNEPYYRGRVVLEQDYLGDLQAGNKILPGMTVQADIVTGKRTILAYLLKPVGRAMQTAMTER